MLDIIAILWQYLIAMVLLLWLIAVTGSLEIKEKEVHLNLKS